MVVEAENRALPRRLSELLLAALQEFIDTAAPVGSQQIASRYRLGLRAAMVRNLMAELEEAGYLYQPHVSAGRMPTEKAFRYYVDRLIPESRVNFHDRTQIELHCSTMRRNLDQTMRETSRLLAELSGQAAVVMAPRVQASVLKRVSLVSLGECRILALFVTAAGMIHSQVVETDADADQASLNWMAEQLSGWLCNRTIEQAREWIDDQIRELAPGSDTSIRRVLSLGQALTRARIEANFYVDGSLNALSQPEFADRQRFSVLLRALNDSSALMELLECSLSRSGPIVSIGSENRDARFTDMSVVAAAYPSSSSPLGSLAVVGPVRMDYGRVIPLVDYTAKALSRALQD